MIKTKNAIHRTFHPQSGRSMIEMLGVLIIVGFLSIGGLSLFEKAIASARANKIIEDVQFALRAKTEEMFLKNNDLSSNIDDTETECSAYLSTNNNMQSCSCKQSNMQAFCNVTVRDKDVAEQMGNKLGISGSALTFCVRSNFKVKLNYNSNDESKKTFGWKSGACDSVFNYNN